MKFSKLMAGVGLAVLMALPVSVQAGTPDDILVIANRIDDIVSLDPQELFEFAGGDYSNNVYDSLVSFDPKDLSTGYQPTIAESWTVSEDGRTFTFKIRKGLKFHSGNPVTAKDAEYSLRRAIAMKKTPSFILTQFGFTADNINETIVATDADTLVVKTDARYATSFVLNCFTAPISYIVDSELVKSHAKDGDWGNEWLRTNSAGSGPYKLQKWKPNDSYSLTRVDGYWRGDAAMKRVIVRHVPESATQRLQLEKGDVDIARNLSTEDIAAANSNSDLAVDDDLRGRIMYLGLSQNFEPFKNAKVIKAIKHLVDYKGMSETFLKGQYKPHQAFLPLTYLGELKDQPYDYNVDKAKALLAEAGYADGFEVEMIVRTAQERLDIAQSLQNTFAKAGIKSTISQGTGKQILGRYRAREFQLYVGAWGPDYPDPHTNADTFAHNPDNRDEAKLTGKLAWRLSWDIPELTKLTTAAVQEGDTAKRAEMYVAIQKQHQESAPFVPMFQKIDQTARRSNVKGFVTGSAITAAYYWTVTK
ncbi:MAG: ABC transporter substrate-binding protein [Hyphomicrobiales bacterium]|nr:MAG: ABC transporter substrate-binding protein [Hyphomicrobiales bacterium]